MGEALDSYLLLLGFLGFWTLLPAPSMAYINSPPPLQGPSGQIPGLPLLWQQPVHKAFPLGFSTSPLSWEEAEGPPALRDQGVGRGVGRRSDPAGFSFVFQTRKWKRQYCQ